MNLRQVFARVVLSSSRELPFIYSSPLDNPLSQDELTLVYGQVSMLMNLAPAATYQGSALMI